MTKRSIGISRLGLGLLSLGACVVARPALADGRQHQIDLHSQVQTAIWEVTNNPSLPGGVTINVVQPAKFDATGYCQTDGYRVSRLGEETMAATKAILRMVVRSGSTILKNPYAEGVEADAKAACERGDASMVTTRIHLPISCKQVKASNPFVLKVERQQAKVYPPTTTQVKCQGFAKQQDKVPLWLYWSAPLQHNMVMPSGTVKFGQGDWVPVRLEGDMWRTEQPGTVALKKWRKLDSVSDELVTTHAPPPGYKDFGTMGYIYDPTKPPPAGTIALMRYYSSARKDWFLNERPEFNPTAEGYSNPVLEGYIFKRF